MCDKTAQFRYTWPGSDEAVVCGDHAGQISNLSKGMGFHLEFIPIIPDDECICSQEGV